MKPKSCEGCPLFNKGYGFVLDGGDPRKAKLAFILEAPGENELKARVSVEELAVRRELYPELPEPSLAVGEPVVGRAGMTWEHWLLKPVGIRREDTYRANTLRCLAPKNKEGSHYPIGQERIEAERHCRQYDRIELFNPTIALVVLHPAALLRELTPLDLVVKHLRKAAQFAAQGEKVVVLHGGKAAKSFLGLASDAITAIGGTYFKLAKRDVGGEPDLLEVGRLAL